MGSDRDKRDESAEFVALIALRAKVADLELQRDGLQAFCNRVVAALGLPPDATGDEALLRAAEARDSGVSRGALNSVASLLGVQHGARPDSTAITDAVIALQEQATRAVGQRVLDERARIVKALGLDVPEPNIDGIISTIARNKQVVESACRERDLARGAEGRVLRDIGEALGLGTATMMPSIIDKITRLREEHARATSEHSSALATERRSHEETKKKLRHAEGETPHLLCELAAILDPALRPADKTFVSVTRATGALVAEVLTLRDQVSEQREIIQDDEHGIVYCTRCEEPYCDALMCPAENSETCWRCPDCHEVDGCDLDGDDKEPTSGPEDEVPSTALLSGLARVLDAVCSAMATDPRDWSVNKTDAWLYGILVGWNEAIEDVAKRHRWRRSRRAENSTGWPRMADKKTPLGEMVSGVSAKLSEVASLAIIVTVNDHGDRFEVAASANMGEVQRSDSLPRLWEFLSKVMEAVKANAQALDPEGMPCNLRETVQAPEALEPRAKA